MAQTPGGAVLGAPLLDRPETAEIDVSSPEFATHLGSLLAATRRRHNRSLRDLAKAAGGPLDAGCLRRIERGSIALDEATVATACHLYGVELETILPSRVAVTIEGRVMIAGNLRVALERDDPTSVLSGYLRLIRSMRDQKKLPAVAVRRDDIERLAEYLGIDGAEVIERMALLMGATAAQRIAIGSLFAAGAIVICLVAAGHADAEGAPAATASAARSIDHTVAAEIVDTPDLLPAGDLVVDSDTVGTNRVSADVATAKVVPHTAAAAVGTTITSTVPEDAAIEQTRFAEVIESSPATDVTESAPVIASSTVPVATDEITAPADSDGMASAVRVQAPVAGTTETTTAPANVENRSGCSTDSAAAVMTLTIPDISYECSVVAGGQSQIDAGFVTLVTDAGPNPVLATRPGDPGTLWLAGHRTTHGAAFAQVPDLADGALITVSDGGVTATYRVVGRTYVQMRNDRVIDADGNATAQATWESIIRSDLSGNLAPRLVLQTCDGANFRWMVYADLVTG